jgi:hypothetical protein
MRQFVVSNDGKNRLGLRELCERFVNDLWVPTHLTDEQAVTFALDQFRRTLLAELEMIDVSCSDDRPAEVKE